MKPYCTLDKTSTVHVTQDQVSDELGKPCETQHKIII